MPHNIFNAQQLGKTAVAFFFGLLTGSQVTETILINCHLLPSSRSESMLRIFKLSVFAMFSRKLLPEFSLRDTMIYFIGIVLGILAHLFMNRSYIRGALQAEKLEQTETEHLLRM